MTLKIVAVISLVSALGCGSSASTEQGFPPRDGGTDAAEDGAASGDAASEAAGPKVLCCLVDASAPVNCDPLNPFKCWNTPMPNGGTCAANCLVGYQCDYVGGKAIGSVGECNQ